MLVACLFQTRPPFRVVVDCADIFLPDHGLNRGRADDFAEPAAVGRAPGGMAGRAHIVPQKKGIQPQCRGLEVMEGRCTRAAQVAAGCSFNVGDIDRGEVP